MAKKKAKEVQEEMKKCGYDLRMASDIKSGSKLKTGIFALDYVLDGGIYQGEGGHRIELYGRENSGKTTFTLALIKKYQEEGKKCVFINGEGSYDVDWAAVNGVDNKKLFIADPMNLEQAGDMLTDFIGKYDLICMDSIPSIVTMEEQEGTMDKKQYASQAKIYSPMMRKLYGATKQHNPTIIMINQLREKIGVSYGNPYTTPGGRALKHFYNTRIEFKIGQMIREKVSDKTKKGDVIGMEVLLNCVKNKRGKPHRVISLDFYINGHIDNKKSLFFAGMKYGVLERKGSTYSFKEKSEVGQDAFINKLDDNDWAELEEEIWKRIK